MIKTSKGYDPTDADWSEFLMRKPALHFYGVITTGIVCRHGCPARTPLRQNVKMFARLNDALGVGFRACKRCKPTDATPES